MAFAEVTYQTVAVIRLASGKEAELVCATEFTKIQGSPDPVKLGEKLEAHGTRVYSDENDELRERPSGELVTVIRWTGSWRPSSASRGMI